MRTVDGISLGFGFSSVGGSVLPLTPISIAFFRRTVGGSADLQYQGENTQGGRRGYLVSRRIKLVGWVTTSETVVTQYRYVLSVLSSTVLTAPIVLEDNDPVISADLATGRPIVSGQGVLGLILNPFDSVGLARQASPGPVVNLVNNKLVLLGEIL